MFYRPHSISLSKPQITALRVLSSSRSTSRRKPWTAFPLPAEPRWLRMPRTPEAFPRSCGESYDRRMGYREERVAQNEATSREINEGIDSAFESEPADAFTFVICECGLEKCDQVLRITKAEYERVRSDPRQFVIVRKHLVADVEQVVFEGDGFVVVAKREGTPAEVAVQEDPGT
jgi:hypothetical protein